MKAGIHVREAVKGHCPQKIEEYPYPEEYCDKALHSYIPPSR